MSTKKKESVQITAAKIMNAGGMLREN